MFYFNIKYFFWFILLLIIELSIALFIDDGFIRPYLGDVLVVILIYTFLKSFLNISVNIALLSVMVFSFTIEFSQLFHFISVLNLEDCQIAHWVLGSSFNSFDFIAYTIGLTFVFLVEKFWNTIFYIPRN